MIIANTVLIFLHVLAAAAAEGSFQVDGLHFDDCNSAIEYAKSLQVPASIECHVVVRIEPEQIQPVGSNEGPDTVAVSRLKDFSEVAEFELDDPDASGLTFIADDTVVITFQNSLEFRGLDGKLKHTIGPVDGDIEGLEYQDGKFIAIAEQGSTHIDLRLDGIDIIATRDEVLPLRGVECIAHDPVTGRTYYGQESTGVLFDDQYQPVMEFQRDLAGCAVFRGELMVLVSHPSRQSVWYRVDMKNWKIIEQRLLPAGNWEGVSCRADTCVLVRETSEKSKAAMVIFKVRSGT